MHQFFILENKLQAFNLNKWTTPRAMHGTSYMKHSLCLHSVYTVTSCFLAFCKTKSALSLNTEIVQFYFSFLTNNAQDIVLSLSQFSMLHFTKPTLQPLISVLLANICTLKKQCKVQTIHNPLDNPPHTSMIHGEQNICHVLDIY